MRAPITITAEELRAFGLAGRPRAKLSGESLRRMVDEGMRVGEIAKAVRRSRSTVQRHLAAHGIEIDSRPGPRSKLPPLDEIVRRLEAGEKASHIASECGAHPSALHLTLYRNGLRLDRGRVLPKVDLEIVPLIACIRMFGAENAPDYFQTTNAEIDEMLLDHGFHLVDGRVEHNASRLGLSLQQTINHIERIEHRVDALIAEWRSKQ